MLHSVLGGDDTEQLLVAASRPPTGDATFSTAVSTTSPTGAACGAAGQQLTGSYLYSSEDSVHIASIVGEVLQGVEAQITNCNVQGALSTFEDIVSAPPPTAVFEESIFFTRLHEVFPNLEASCVDPNTHPVLLNLEAAPVTDLSAFDFNESDGEAPVLPTPFSNASKMVHESKVDETADSSTTSRKRPRRCSKKTYGCEFSDTGDFSANESEYEPDSPSPGDENSDEDSGASFDHPSSAPQSVEKYDLLKKEQTVSEDNLVNEDISKTNTCSPEGLNIMRASTGPKGRRIWDKRYPCKFCKKLDLKLPRHFERHHSDEAEVAAFLALKKKSKQRKEMIEKLRCDGEKLYHFDNYAKRKGILHPKKRPTKETGIDDYLPCEECCRLIKKTYLARHVQKCKKGKMDSEKEKIPLRGLQARCALLLPSAPQVPENFKSDILQKMSYNDIFKELSTDKIILRFGQKLYSYLGRHSRNHRTIKDRLRELGRFMISVKSLSPDIQNLEALMHPTKYNIIIAAIKKTAGLNEQTGQYESPSLAIKLVQSLKKCIVVHKSMCLDDSVLLLNLPHIKLLEDRMEENATTDVNREAHATIAVRKWNAPRRLPLTEDVKKLHTHLLHRNDECREALSSGTSDALYRDLCEITLCRILLLNRRRVGEIQAMLLQDYLKSKENPPQEDSDVMKCLSDVEKTLVKTLQRVEIRGKKGRGVPVLLTEDMQAAVDALIRMRVEVGVPEENPYLFPALHSSAGHHRADVILRKFAGECGASDPSTLRGTRLRKHVATLTQLLNLRENELDALADFMGHDIRVHRQFYRLSSDTMQLAKISKVLLNMERGHVDRMRGLNLDEVTVDDVVEDVDEEQVDDPGAGQGPEEDESSGSRCPPKTPATKKRSQSTTASDAKRPMLSGHQSDPDYRSSDSDFSAATKKKTQSKGIKRASQSEVTSKKRQRFPKDQSVKILTYFERSIKNKVTPQKGDVLKFFEAHPELSEIPWERIKYHVYAKFAERNKKRS